MNITFKRLINPLFSSMVRSTYFRYATEGKNVFTLPLKQNIPPSTLCQITSSIQQVYTVKMGAYLFRDNIKNFLDLHVAALFEHISIKDLAIDETMHSIIVPITIEYINVFTIQNATSLGQIALSSLNMGLENDYLWEAILRKLDGQNIYRYLTLDITAILLNAFVKHGKFINHPLIGKLSAVVNKQQAYYQHFPHLMAQIRSASQILEEKGQKPLQISQAHQQIA